MPGGSLLERLHGGGEGGGAGGGAREEAGGERRVQAEQPAREVGERRRQRDGEDREAGVADPVAPQRGHERPARREADGVHEDRQAEHVDDLGERQRGVEGPGREAHEEHRRDAEPAAPHLYLAERVAEGRHQEQQQERVLREEPDEGVEHGGGSGSVPAPGSPRAALPEDGDPGGRRGERGPGQYVSFIARGLLRASGKPPCFGIVGRCGTSSTRGSSAEASSAAVGRSLGSGASARRTIARKASGR